MARGLRIGHAPVSGDIPAANPLPAGALSFTVNWEPVAGAAGYVVFLATATQAEADPALYAYRYLASGGGSSSLVISNVQSGAKYGRVAAHDGTWLTELGVEVVFTPA